MSKDEEFATRRRRYAVLMAIRAICIVAAALVYRASALLALALIVGGAVLPWCAVLIANDRLPKNRRTRRAYVTVPETPALPAADGERTKRVIDGASEWQNRQA